MHNSLARFHSELADGFLSQSHAVLTAFDIPAHFEGRDRLLAKIEDVSVSIRRARDQIEIDLSASNPDSLSIIRAAIQAQLEVIDPRLGDLHWEGAFKPGNLPAYFSFAHVEAMEILSEDFVRLVLHGGDLARFGKEGLHFRILRQRDTSQPAVWPRLNARGGIDWPKKDEQLIHRAYTSRAVDPQEQKITVDIYRHADGPTAAWAESNPIGEVVGLTGPGGGWIPQGDWMLLGGDETAQPAILRLLEELPAQTGGQAFVIAGSRGREGHVRNQTQIKLTWLYRDENPDLVERILSHPIPKSETTFLWFAASKTQARIVRNFWRNELGRSTENSYASGYWDTQ